jgi:hypothetical protein
MNNPGASAVAPAKERRSAFVEPSAANSSSFAELAENFPPVIIIQNETTYEELTHVGLDPAGSKLEAVIDVKQPNGYGTPAFPQGAFEYVRFYVDYGAGFEDQGYIAVNVDEASNVLACAKVEGRRLHFTASIAISPHKVRRLFPVRPKVRAILSWQSIPPANAPNFNPMWGNRLDAQV